MRTTFNNIDGDIHNIGQTIILFEKGIQEILLELEKKTQLPLNEMLKFRQVEELTYGSVKMPCKYSFTYNSKINHVIRVKISFYTDGTISLKLFWYDRSRPKIKFEKISTEALLNLSDKINTHLIFKEV